MLYKFFNKKGNITVVLIGLISVMLLMTLALSKRMTGHTQLLTLGDYTQISRYFLESYVSHVLQQVRAQVNDPTSELNKKICEGFDGDIDEEVELTESFNYEESSVLEELTTIYGNNNKIKRIDPPVLKLTKRSKILKYPEGIKPPSDKGNVEKRGYLEIICKCEFNKKEYTLTVQYPFSVVYRMTPILKDFMLYVDNMWYEQKAYSNDGAGVGWAADDKINILGIEKGKVNKTDKSKTLEKDFSIPTSNYKIRPMVLLSPYQTGNDDYKTSGMVYWGPTSNNGSPDDTFEKSIYYNLSGITPDSEVENENIDLNDMYLIPKYAFDPDEGLENNENNSQNKKPVVSEISDNEVTFPLGYNGTNIKAYGVDVELEEGHKAGTIKIGVFGFGKEISSFLGKTSDKWKIEDFLGDNNSFDGRDLLKDTFWGKICDESDSDEYLKYASGIRLFGLHYKGVSNLRTQRQIFGNIFERFLVLTFWEFENGEALIYNPDLAINEIQGIAPTYLPDRIMKFWPKGYREDMPRNEQVEIYRRYMSKIMSGLKAKDNYKKDEFSPGKYQDLFIPLNINYELTGKHEIYYEDKCKPNDGFEIKRGWFDLFGKKWFEPSNDNNIDNIEQRIGRAYKDQKKFKNAVGLNNKKKKQFKINGVVYVKGDLDLSEGMDLKPEDCSGGIVLVDGDLTIGNITRGESITASKFEYVSDASPATDYFTKWNDENKPETYIGPDKILTFVCIGKDRKITIKGNVLLGVQLINLTSSSPERENHDDQISWKLDSNKDEIIFLGSIVCNRLNLVNRLLEFGKITKSSDKVIDAPFFVYPPSMSTENPPLAVQIMEDMRSYQLTSGVVSE